MHKLKIINSRNHIEEITLPEGIHTIGRSMDSTLRLEGEEVSRAHARLSVKPSHCELTDEGSKNGTFINGKRVVSSNLYNDDIIQIGAFNLKFVSDTARPHLTLGQEKKSIRIPFLSICLFIGLIIFAGLFLRQKTLEQKTRLKLAERTAQYLAERNKEALYLGEYYSINLTALPPEVIQVAVWDRNGVLRAYQPIGTEPMTMEAPNGICVPINYESVRVGTLGLVYSL